MEKPAPETQRIFAPGIFKDQVAIVTGGGSGIGLATALELVRLGAPRRDLRPNAEKLEAAATLAELRGADRVLALPCDIREPAQVEAFVKEVDRALGPASTSSSTTPAVSSRRPRSTSRRTVFSRS